MTLFALWGMAPTQACFPPALCQADRWMWGVRSLLVNKRNVNLKAEENNSSYIVLHWGRLIAEPRETTVENPFFTTMRELVYVNNRQAALFVYTCSVYIQLYRSSSAPCWILASRPNGLIWQPLQILFSLREQMFLWQIHFVTERMPRNGSQSSLSPIKD